MKSKKKIVAVIPARGRSKSIPRKNIISIGGKPLIAYTIEAALKAKQIGKVVVSSDDEEILAISKSLGADAILRPKKLAANKANSESAAFHALTYLRESGEDFETMIFLQPTSPLRNQTDISNALNLYLAKRATALISVYEPPHTPFKAFKVNRGGFLEGLVDNKTPFLRRQDLPKAYLPNGAIYIVDVEQFLKNQSFFTAKTLYYQMPAERSDDLDSYEDIKILEQKIAGRAPQLKIANQPIDNPKVLVVIPARGGSKRLPGKNIKLLAGKPLIAYAIRAALGTDLVDEVIVSTDDKKIAEVAKRCGARVPFLRPAELAADTALVMDVVDHAVCFLERTDNRHYKIVVLVQPTSPLVQPSDIDRAIAQLTLSKAEVCASVSEITDRPERMFQIADNGKAVPFGGGCNDTVRSQDFPKLFKLNGAIYAMKREIVKKGGNIVNRKNLNVVEMKKENSIDIDDLFDFILCEAILKKKDVNKS